jgi:hypothetical protein
MEKLSHIHEKVARVWENQVMLLTWFGQSGKLGK